MKKNIVIEVSGGVVQSVWCPSEEFEIHLLDHDDYEEELTPELKEYYEDLEKEIKNLINCL